MALAKSDDMLSIVANFLSYLRSPMATNQQNRCTKRQATLILESYLQPPTIQPASQFGLGAGAGHQTGGSDAAASCFFLEQKPPTARPKKVVDAGESHRRAIAARFWKRSPR
jgi:hypothetical protein